MRKAVVELDSDEENGEALDSPAPPVHSSGPAVCPEVTSAHSEAASAIVAALECSARPSKRLKEVPRVVTARGNALEYLWGRIRDANREARVITAASLRACLTAEGVAATDSEVRTMLELYASDGNSEITFEGFQKAVSDAQLKVSKAGRVW
mmetsp:Transcript_24676/g.52631  ORF Transcript_24676/g.52631 Transcript_24676/m.52631 type:complete len:152 (-) Transcript_24676:300-755(-)|eukprot:CAMPEP_0204277742 /NCGR_PEP_ID=MMETSP0468-20130131/29481_1 /ASSEMBLY_ACC=CAM_ASM_000383 /TAXON_ID=2969 /ORGANISM="Oxyrrhis marina" /LENGTH=151 /DNA_ID=CAMNT_0051254573 /DNA_START=66 /DNA_END=518 /DNA_ORIENTATION=-